MTFSRLIAATALAVVPFAAGADDPFSPFVRIYAGERGIDFVTPPSMHSRAGADARAAANPGAVRVTGGEQGYVFEVVPSTLSRAEVLAELRAAQRLGLVTYGEAGPPVATPEQEALIARAGELAASLQATAPSLRRR